MARINILGVPHSYELTPPRAGVPVLVFIHGWLLSRAYWQPLIDRLSPHYQCLSYDLRGFGDSRSTLTNPRQLQGHRLEKEETIPREYTPAALAQDLALLLDSLKITGAVWLVGHSLGGTIALWGAAQLPDLVKGVICINAGGGIYLKEEFERFRSAGENLVKRRPTWLKNVPLIDFLFARAMVFHPLDRAWGKQRVLDFINADSTAALGTLLDCTTEAEVHKLPSLVCQLSQPVYFLAGQNDRIMEPKYVQHLASFHHLFRSGINNVIEVPQCGHMAMLEYPDLVAEQMSGILTTNPQPALNPVDNLCHPPLELPKLDLIKENEWEI